MKAYIPINCSYYDELEAIATRRKTVEITYRGAEDQLLTISARIVDFKIIEKTEYMILADEQKIRLDYLVSVDGKPLPPLAC